MKKTIQNVLGRILEHGHQAYVVGGYPRDLYLGRKTLDIDVCTSATPKELQKIFSNVVLPREKYGAVILHYHKLCFEITTFRKEIKYSKHRKPKVIQYVSDIKTDLLRRDFTINTLCLDYDENIVDYLGIKKDLDDKIIKTIQEAAESLEKDALRILRAIRLATVLDFTIDEDLKKAIKKKSYLLGEISYERKKSELDKVFTSKNVKRGIALIIELDIYKSLDLDLPNIVITKNYLGIWAQLDVIKKYPFTKEEKQIINNINKMLLEDRVSKYNIYKYGLYISIIVAEIKKYDVKKIINIYENLPIKEKEEIVVKREQLFKIISRKNDITKVCLEIEEKIVEGKLLNNKAEIISYLNQKYL